MLSVQIILVVYVVILWVLTKMIFLLKGSPYAYQGLSHIVKPFSRNSRPPVYPLRSSGDHGLVAGLYLSDFHWEGQSFDWRLATIAGMVVAKLVPWNSLLN